MPLRDYKDTFLHETTSHELIWAETGSGNDKNKNKMPCYRREEHAMPLYISIHVEFYNRIVRFLCHITALLLVFVCRLQWITVSVKKWQVLERTSHIAYLMQTSNHVITLNYCHHHYSLPT